MFVATLDPATATFAKQWQVSATSNMHIKISQIFHGATTRILVTLSSVSNCQTAHGFQQISCKSCWKTRRLWQSITAHCRSWESQTYLHYDMYGILGMTSLKFHREMRCQRPARRQVIFATQAGPANQFSSMHKVGKALRTHAIHRSTMQWSSFGRCKSRTMWLCSSESAGVIALSRTGREYLVGLCMWKRVARVKRRHKRTRHRKKFHRNLARFCVLASLSPERC